MFYKHHSSVKLSDHGQCALVHMIFGKDFECACMEGHVR